MEPVLRMAKNCDQQKGRIIRQSHFPSHSAARRKAGRERPPLRRAQRPAVRANSNEWRTHKVYVLDRSRPCGWSRRQTNGSATVAHNNNRAHLPSLNLAPACLRRFRQSHSAHTAGRAQEAAAAAEIGQLPVDAIGALAAWALFALENLE